MRVTRRGRGPEEITASKNCVVNKLIDFHPGYSYTKTMKKYIVSNPEILGGKPVVAGTRIPIGQILFLLKEGFTLEAINEEYPQLNKKTLEGAVEEAVKLVEINVSKVL